MSAQTMIDFGSLFVALKPFADTLLPMVASGAAAYAGRAVSKRANVQITAEQQKILTDAAASAAGYVWAKAEPSIATAKLDVHSPGIAAAAQVVINGLPAIAKAFGVTPEKAQELVLGQLGMMQAKVAAGAPAPLPPKAAA